MTGGIESKGGRQTGWGRFIDWALNGTPKAVDVVEPVSPEMFRRAAEVISQRLLAGRTVGEPDTETPKVLIVTGIAYEDPSMLPFSDAIEIFHRPEDRISEAAGAGRRIDLTPSYTDAIGNLWLNGDNWLLRYYGANQERMLELREELLAAFPGVRVRVPDKPSRDTTYLSAIEPKRK